jgi:hypothetical protein
MAAGDPAGGPENKNVVLPELGKGGRKQEK